MILIYLYVTNKSQYLRSINLYIYRKYLNFTAFFLVTHCIYSELLNTAF